MRILWLKTGPLHPLDTGGKLRTYHMLRALRANNHVTFLALCSPEQRAATDKAGEYSDAQVWVDWQETPKRSGRFFTELGTNLVFSNLPYVISKYQSPEMANVIRQYDIGREFDLIICDFLTPSINLFANGWWTKSPVLLFQHNVESLIWKRLYQTASGLKKIYFRDQWKRMVAFEKKACAASRAVVAVSEEDAALLRSELRLTNVLGAVPTGVDAAGFASCRSAKKKPKSLVFLGSMDWMPNIDAVLWFSREIFPALKKRFPEMTLSVVGRNPTADVNHLAKISGIEITGTVDDVKPFMGEAELMIVPLRVGGGPRVKIFEGMAAGLPIVSTRIGAEGLPVRDGENIFLADTPDTTIEKISMLLDKPELRSRMGANAAQFVTDNYSWESATRKFEDYCHETLTKRSL
ncbi:MAG: glycosyltransferase family 4 protein [Limisphaerales bacterium]